MDEIIPHIIWQTWHTKNLPPQMQENVEMLKQQHPTLQHNLFDIPMCRDFIRNHFRPEILKAYDSLKPYAFKSDLWRYCVLYIHGGIYMDMRYKCVDDFRLTEFLEEEHYVRGAAPTNIYNGLIVCKPKNPFLLKIINILTYHINQRIIETSVFFGPILLGKILRPHVNCSMIYRTNKICRKDKTVLTTYLGYFKEKKGQPHWLIQLGNKNIFCNK